MTSSEIAFALFIAKHNLPMAVGDEFGLLAKKMWCSTVPVAHPGGEKNTNYRFSRFFVRAVPLFRSLMLTPVLSRTQTYVIILCSFDLARKHLAFAFLVFNSMDIISNISYLPESLNLLEASFLVHRAPFFSKTLEGNLLLLKMTESSNFQAVIWTYCLK